MRKRKNSKRRITAQRKFAQGVLIPVLNNNTLVSRCDPISKEAPVAEPAPVASVIQNNITASSLLDIVSFKNIHPHKEPVVLLERIDSSSDRTSVQNDDNESELAQPSTSTGIQSSYLSWRPPRAIAKTKMITRSSTRVTTPYLRTRTVYMEKMKRASSTYDTEDETPLKYLKLRSQTRAETSSPESNAAAGEKSAAPKVNKGVALRSKRSKTSTRMRTPYARARLLRARRASTRRAVPSSSSSEEEDCIILRKPLPESRSSSVAGVSDKSSSAMRLRSEMYTEKPTYQREQSDHRPEVFQPSINYYQQRNGRNIEEIAERLRLGLYTEVSQNESESVAQQPEIIEQEFKDESSIDIVEHDVGEMLSKKLLTEENIILEIESAELQPEMTETAEPNTDFVQQQNLPEADQMEIESAVAPLTSYYGRSGISQWIDTRQPPIPIRHRRQSCTVRLYMSTYDASLAPQETKDTFCKTCKRCLHLATFSNTTEMSTGSLPRSPTPTDVYVFEEDREHTTPPTHFRRMVADETSPTQPEDDNLSIIPNSKQMAFTMLNNDERNSIVSISFANNEDAPPPAPEKTTPKEKRTTRQKPVRKDVNKTIAKKIKKNKKVTKKKQKGKSKDPISKPIKALANKLAVSLIRTPYVALTRAMPPPTNAPKGKSKKALQNKGNLLEVPTTTKSTRARTELNSATSMLPPSDPSPGCSSQSTLRPVSNARPSTSLSELYAPLRSWARDPYAQMIATPSVSSDVPPMIKNKLVEAPVFKLTEEEFNDPIQFFEKVQAQVTKYGICKVVAPESFKPKCSIQETIFQVFNQYVGSMFNRWGPAARELCAIKAHVSAQKVNFVKSPLLDGLEMNLPLLYHVVQRLGGLKQVIEKKRWARVAEELHLGRDVNAEKALDKIYVKYLLPYDTLTPLERQQKLAAVEKCWSKRHQRTMEMAMNPLRRQMKLLEGDTDASSDDDNANESGAQVLMAVSDAEDCVSYGRKMKPEKFKKIAMRATNMHFPNGEPSVEEVEQKYWHLVQYGAEHVCVYTASLDTSKADHGFTKKRDDPMRTHPWNLKVLSNNNRNVLRSLGSVVGVTAPTLHLGMVFSTSCWHRDPHGLPWVEYMHLGPPKIWYGIPDCQSANFRQAVERLCPTACQNKSIWLPSDIIMIPPDLLSEYGVSLSRVVQNPGEFVFVLPKSYSCSIATGYTVSESVYFATEPWLYIVPSVFKELRMSCEPATFSLENLLIMIAKDTKQPNSRLAKIYFSLKTVIEEELLHRQTLRQKGLRVREEKNTKARRRCKLQRLPECDVCRTTLYLSKVTGVPEKNSALCLQHAIIIASTEKYNDFKNVRNPVELVVHLSDTELQNLQDTVHDKCFRK